MKKLEVGVYEGRHEMPCKNFMFGQEIDQKWLENPTWLEALASSRFWRLLQDANLITWHQVPSEDYYYADDCVGRADEVELEIYVTGLTIAVFAIVNAAKAWGFEKITLMHYNRESGQYYPQEVR